MQDNIASFKKLLDRVEEINEILNRTDLTLEESINLAEEAIKIIKRLRVIIHSGSGKVSKIKVVNGKVIIEPFD